MNNATTQTAPTFTHDNAIDFAVKGRAFSLEVYGDRWSLCSVSSGHFDHGVRAGDLLVGACRPPSRHLRGFSSITGSMLRDIAEQKFHSALRAAGGR